MDNIKKTPLCACGCGLFVKWNKNKKQWNIFIYSHNLRNKKIQEKRLINSTKASQTEEHREKVSQINKRHHKEHPERAIKHSKTMKLLHENNPEIRQKISDGIKKAYDDNPELREKASISTKKRYEDPSEREKTGQAIKKSYEDNPEQRENKIAGLAKYYEDNPEARKIRSESLKKYYEDNPELRERQRISTIERFEDLSEREKLSDSIKNAYARPELNGMARRRMLKAYKDNPGLNKKVGDAVRKYYEDHPERRIKVGIISSKIMKQRWQNPEYISKMLLALGRSPNIPEALLSILTPEQVIFVGNGKWWRTLKIKTNEGIVTKHKNPDFLVKGQHKVIEFNGDYFHKDDYPDELWQEAWAGIGYQVLIIWEHELKDIDSVLNRIAKFIGQDSWQMQLAI
jgi:very-short-patch-repair endonuclease